MAYSLKQGLAQEDYGEKGQVVICSSSGPVRWVAYFLVSDTKLGLS